MLRSLLLTIITSCCLLELYIKLPYYTSLQPKIWTYKFIFISWQYMALSIERFILNGLIIKIIITVHIIQKHKYVKTLKNNKCKK